MPSHNTYHLTWVSLTLDMGYLFTTAPAKHSRCSFPWTRGISSRPPLLTLNVEWLLSALLHPCSHQSLDLGLLLLATTPSLRHGVAPGMWSQVGLRSITMNKASGGDGIPVELFQILKDDAVKMLHSIFQQIWKTQQWPQDWKRSVFIPIPKKGNAKECSNYHTIALISHASKVMLKILQARP